MRRREMPPRASGLPVVADADLEIVAETVELDCTDE